MGLVNLLYQQRIMGNPNYEVTEGEILFDGVNVLDLEVDERARLGLFLAMQYPSEIPGITNAEFMRAESMQNVTKTTKCQSCSS